MKKPANVEVLLCFSPTTLPEKRVSSVVKPYLQYDGFSKDTIPGYRYLTYVGQLTSTRLANLRERVRKMRRWKGVVGITLNVEHRA